MAASSAGPAVRSWRTAFLTLRDEALTNPPCIPKLVHSLIFSHSHSSFVSAATDLPSLEVTSDLLFLIELVANASQRHQDSCSTFSQTCHLIFDLCHRVSLEISSSSWTLILHSFAKLMDCFLAKAGSTSVASSNAVFVKPAMECLETVRLLLSAHHRKFSLSDDIELVNFLLCIIAHSHVELILLYQLTGNQSCTAETGKNLPRCCSFWEFQTNGLSMLAEAFSRVGSSFPVDIWQSTIKVLRKIIDVLASRNLIMDDNVMSRFYESLLHCLHLILTDPKCSISEHVSGFVAALQMFFIYGLTGRPQLASSPVGHIENERDVPSLKNTIEKPRRTGNTPYRPPHLRKKERFYAKQARAKDSQSSSDNEPSTLDVTSSDSDYSDNDGLLKHTDSDGRSKVRVAAILCIQDLCQADPKSFTSQWTMLLPTNDILEPRKFEATLMTCLLFDPYLKARIVSASTLAAMLDGPSSIFLQVAEYKEPSKCGSFTPLSSSLGQILMQLHIGILFLIQREMNSRLLMLLFKILVLLISCTPYSRMPGELLSSVITSLQARVEQGFPFKSDQTGLLVAAFSCLTAALSVPPSTQVKEMFSEELAAGLVEAEKRSGVLFTLFQHSGQVSSPTICFEALQALRGVSHSYPNLIVACWGKVSAIVHRLFREATVEVASRTWKEQARNTCGFIGEKVVTAAIKVLDESLRAVSGFKGTEDHSHDMLFDTPFTSDCIRTKKVSSAPSYEPESLATTEEERTACQPGSEQWAETIEKHMPLILGHTSAMVRTASVTCFAGITSSAFFTLTREKQDFVVSTLINSAMHDKVPSVRSAACRAIGVISCFPQISESSEIIGKFIRAIELNTHDPLVSVRITASWALANICDSLNLCIDDIPSKQLTDSNVKSQIVELLIQCALRLSEDGDKIKANAVRALGNLSRLVRYTSSSCVHNKPADILSVSSTSNNARILPSNSALRDCPGNLSNSCHPESSENMHWLEKMVQAFLSCVMTGNVKVQWNVCHALSNLFLNESLKLQDMDWAPSVFSILLLLLRDSSNFKIRIQAAAALAVPSSASGYGKSFSDVVQGLQHVVENLGSDQISAPLSFRYMIALEKQLTSTMLHVLSLVSSTNHQQLKDFLVKKATFLEEWFKMLCSLLGETSAAREVEKISLDNQKKEMMTNAIRSLIEVYESGNYQTIAKKFQELDCHLS